MSLNQILQVMPPPEHPVDIPSAGDWSVFENQVSSVPQDFKEFVGTYGVGCIDDFIWLFNPATQNPNLNLARQTQAQTATFRELFSQRERKPSFPLLPESSGLLPLGLTDNGDVLFWFPSRGANGRLVVAEARGPKYEIFEMAVIDWLYRILSRQLSVSMFPSDFPSHRPMFRML